MANDGDEQATPATATAGPAGQVVVRPEQTEDFGAIRAVVVAAFEAESHGDLVEAIRASPGYRPELSLVAVAEAQEVVHVPLSAARRPRIRRGHRHALGLRSGPSPA